MTALLPSARSARPLVAAVMLAAPFALAACASPIGSAFSDPEISIQPPPSIDTPYGLYQPTATQF